MPFCVFSSKFLHLHAPKHLSSFHVVFHGFGPLFTSMCVLELHINNSENYCSKPFQTTPFDIVQDNHFHCFILYFAVSTFKFLYIRPKIKVVNTEARSIFLAVIERSLSWGLEDCSKVGSWMECLLVPRPEWVTTRRSWSEGNILGV